MVSKFSMCIVVLTLLAVFGLAGCGGGGGENSTPSPTSSGITSTGGTVGMNGVTVVIPAKAIDNGLNVSITATTEDNLPGTAPAGATVASKTIVLTKSSSYNFNEPVQVTMPYSNTLLDTGDVPNVFYWDDTAKLYRVVGVKNIDSINKTVTFSTVHFSKFVALGVKGLAKKLGIAANSTPATIPATDTGFRANTDGFYHPNFGAYDAPGGSCLGMSNFSVWYYTTMKKNNSNAGLYTMYKEGDADRWEDDLTSRELISRAFIASSQSWAKTWIANEYLLGPDLTGLLIITALQITGAPMPFIMTDQWPGMTSGHAAVVYKYDANKFYIYDDNFPGEEVTIDWAIDPVTKKYKFSNYTKNAGYNPPFTHFFFEGLSTASEANQYQILYDRAKDKFSSGSSFSKITITSAVDSKNSNLTIAADGSITLPDSDTMTIAGTVTGGIKSAAYVTYALNGGTKTSVPVTGGNFTIALPKITNGSNTLMLVATDDQNNAWNAYGGFKEINIKIQGQLFFINAGFESSLLTPWIHESHTWSNTVAGSFTPEKSVIVSSGTDPIATDIPTPYRGIYAMRVNNSDNNFHISSVSQSATVPNVSNPQVRFYWAAVLEDPQHSPADQPYVDVLVTDTTSGTTLYNKHFYANDPSYSGWLSYNSGQWKVISWQPITLNFGASAIGHKITVKLTAADCALGAHGGYAYLDGDE